MPGGRSERKDTTVVQNYFAVMEFVFPFVLRTNESSVRTVVHQHELVCTALDVGMIARGARIVEFDAVTGAPPDGDLGVDYGFVAEITQPQVHHTVRMGN